MYIYNYTIYNILHKVLYNISLSSYHYITYIMIYILYIYTHTHIHTHMVVIFKQQNNSTLDLVESVAMRTSLLTQGKEPHHLSGSWYKKKGDFVFQHQEMKEMIQVKLIR